MKKEVKYEKVVDWHDKDTLFTMSLIWGITHLIYPFLATKDMSFIISIRLITITDAIILIIFAIRCLSFREVYYRRKLE